MGTKEKGNPSKMGYLIRDDLTDLPNNKSLAWKFACASRGLKWVFSSQKNIKIHLIAAVAVLSAAVWVNMETRDLVLLVAAIALVFVSETINSAVEKTVDLACPHHHPVAAMAKDAAAGAVLLAAFFSVMIGLLVFFPYVEKWLAVML